MKRVGMWMRLGQPIEPVLADQQRVLDAWDAGGVRGLVLGRLTFLPDIPDDALTRSGASAGAASPDTFPRLRPASWGGMRVPGVWAFSPNPDVYRRWGVPPPPDPPQAFAERRARLSGLVDEAKSRGWPVYIFEPGAGSGQPAPGLPGAGGPLITDEGKQRAYLARLEDTLSQFPGVDGVILDGPEWGYEIAPGHRSNLFDDLPSTVEPAATQLGFDYDRMVAAKDRLFVRLHALGSRDAATARRNGLWDRLALFDQDADLAAWIAFRARALTAFYAQVRRQVDDLSARWGRPIALGVGPRLPAFAAVCGYDLAALSRLFDVILPKLYIWQRGFDGAYGTIGRYVSTLRLWNPGLPERDCFAVARALTGLTLPCSPLRSVSEANGPMGAMEAMEELEEGFPDAFFRVLVDELRRVVDEAPTAVGVVPWIDAGRKPHDGDPVAAGDLRRLVVAAADGGCGDILYHNHGHLTTAEWSVLTRACGEAWEPGLGRHGNYLPPDG